MATIVTGFTFVKFKDGGNDMLYGEESYYAEAGYPLKVGMALTVSSGKLIYADETSKVYGICAVSAASSIVTGAYKPKVFPVNDRQIWRAAIGSAVAVATGSIVEKYGTVNASTAVGMDIDATNYTTLASAMSTAINVAFKFVGLTTGDFYGTSAAYVIFS